MSSEVQVQFEAYWEKQSTSSFSLFQEMDKNDDGQITKEEFIAACLGQKEISKMLAIKIIDIFIEDE